MTVLDPLPPATQAAGDHVKEEEENNDTGEEERDEEDDENDKNEAEFAAAAAFNTGLAHCNRSACGPAGQARA